MDALAGGPGRDGRLTHLEVLPAPRRGVRRVAGVGGPRRAWQRFVRPRHPAALAAPGGRRRRRPRRASTSCWPPAPRRASRSPTCCPALTAIREGRGPRGQRGAAVLYLAPTKALAHDQLRPRSAPWAWTSGRPPTTVTPRREQRDWTRDYGEYVLTNPDMLHRSLLPGHERWARFFGSLRYVVVDECHHYRGVFGAHVAHVLRRLRRVCARVRRAPDVRPRLGHRGRARGRRPAG